jgi:hypothetical protein
MGLSALTAPNPTTNLTKADLYQLAKYQRSIWNGE